MIFTGKNKFELFPQHTFFKFIRQGYCNDLVPINPASIESISDK